MRKWLVTMLIGILFALGACSNETEEATSEAGEVDVEEMEEILKDSCISCHSGDFALSAGETDLPVEDIQDLILNGIGTMPAIDSVSEEEALELAKYLAK